MKSRMKGFTLIELLLASFAVITAFYFIVGFVQNQASAAKANRLASEITVFRDRTRAAYANAPDYLALSNTEVINRKLVPPSWVTGGSVLAIEYGALDVAPGNFGQSGGSFKVTLPELPADVCLSMLPVILQSGVTTLSGSNGRTVYIDDDAPLTDRGAVTRAACAAQVDLTFEFV